MSDRLTREIQALREGGNYHIARNDSVGGIEIRDWRYPDGWELTNRRSWRQREGVPRHPEYVAPLLLMVLKNYPRTRPYVYVPRDIRYTKGDVEHFVDDNRDRWLLWCIEDPGWDPQTSTLATFLKKVQASFSYPNTERPLQYAIENMD